MIVALLTICAMLAWMYAGWILFIFWSDTYAHRKQLPGALQVAVWPALIVGAIMDISFNITVASIIFLQFPPAWTLTGRLHSNKLGPDGYRKKVSCWVCRYMLDIFRRGHC